MYFWSSIAMVLLLSGCAGSKPQPTSNHTTPECMRYNSMRTAPMAPEAMQRLALACQDSMGDGR